VIACDFQKGVVKEKITGTKNIEQEIKIAPGTFCFDNNFIPSFALICSQLDIKENTQIDVRTFHPSTMQVLPLAFQVKGRRAIKIGEREVECFECFVTLIKNTFWITPDGRLVRIEAAGGLAIDLHPLE
jgi:hypothetical protein